MQHFPRLSRYSLGARIDNTFIETVELILVAAYSSKEQKNLALDKASTKLDSLKFLLQISWELKLLDHKKYAAVSNPLDEVGKMLGGWQKQLSTKTPSV